MPGEHKEGVSKLEKEVECGIRANTRFAPTKGFRLDVGVNLVFTRYFETASKVHPYLYPETLCSLLTPLTTVLSRAWVW